MSRIQISLPDAAVGQLRVIAEATGEPASRVAARFVLSTLAGETRAQPPAAPVVDPTPSGERRFNAKLGMPVDWGKRGI